MNWSNLQERFVGLKADNRALRVGLLLLILSNVLLSWKVLVKSEIVTIIPSTAMSQQKYTSDTADEEALKGWGNYVAMMLGNVTPSNADFTAEIVGRLLEPGIYREVMDGIAKQIKTIKQEQLTLQFSASALKYDAANRVAYVTGWLSTTDAHGSSQRQQRTYEIWFKVVGYQPRIVSLNAYEGQPKVAQ